MTSVNERGSIALITVIVISGILLASGIALTLLSADLALSTENYSARIRLEGSVRTCLEESLHHIKINKSFTGLVEYSENGDSCTADVSDDPGDPNMKVIVIEAAFEEFEANRTHRVDVTTEPFQLLE